jgi:hypothetical protein
MGWTSRVNAIERSVSYRFPGEWGHFNNLILGTLVSYMKSLSALETLRSREGHRGCMTL